MVLSDISVVISTYTIDRFKYVSNCIESLERQTLPPKEIILVLDPSRPLQKYYTSRITGNVKVMIPERTGLSNARNVGVKGAISRIVAFIDDDAVAAEDWLQNLVKNYDNPKVLGVGGIIKPMWEDGSPSWFPEELYWIVGCSYRGLPESKSYVRNPIGCNMSFRKDIFERVGCFKPDVGRVGKKLSAGEEVVLSTRILREIPGSKILYDPSAVVYHKVPKERVSLGYVLKRSFHQGIAISMFSSMGILTTESSYLKYLLKTSIPSRLKHIYRLKNLLQLLLLVTSMCAVLAGFFIGSLRRSEV